MKPPRELWQCPKCGAKFVTPNMWHSCGTFTTEALFARATPLVFQMFHQLEALVQEIGPVTVIPQKTRAVFMVRVRFLACYPLKTALRCEFGLARRLASPRFEKITRYTPRWYGHSLRLTSEAELDAEFKEWMREAYALGTQAHLRAEK